MQKSKKEYRIGTGTKGLKGTQGWYIKADSKVQARVIFINQYFRKHLYSKNFHIRMTREDERYIVKQIRSIKVWLNANGSLPAWRKRK